MKLTDVKSGQIAVVRTVQGDKRFMSRITSIGLPPGSKLEVLRNENRYPLLVYAKNTMVGLNRQECEKILVEVVNL